MSSTDSEKFVIKLLVVDIDQVTLEGLGIFLGCGSFFELFSGIMPLNSVFFLVQSFDEHAYIVISSKEMLVLLVRLLFELFADRVELVFGVCFLSKKVVDSMESAAEGVEFLVFEVRLGFRLRLHLDDELGLINKIAIK